MKYKVGDKVRFKPLSWFKNNCAKVQNGYKYGEDTQVITKADLSTCGEVGVIEAVTSKGRYMTSLSVDVYPEWVFDFAEMEEILIPFDLEKAKAGAELITTTGKKARIISYDRICGYYSIVALVLDGIESVCYFNNNGECQFDHKLKLMIKEYRPKNQTELTMQQIADKFGVKVENLKIKQ